MSKGEEASLSKALSGVLTVLALVGGLLLLFVTLSIGYSIFARAVGIRSPAWVVQFNEYALLWITFLASAWVLRRGKHVSVDLVTGRLHQKGRAIMEMIHGFLGMTVCVVLLWYGTMVVWSHHQRGVTDVQVVDMPKYLILVAIPFGFFWLALEFLNKTINAYRLTGFKPLERDVASGLQSPQDPSAQRIDPK